VTAQRLRQLPPGPAAAGGAPGVAGWVSTSGARSATPRKKTLQVVRLDYTTQSARQHPGDARPRERDAVVRLPISTASAGQRHLAGPPDQHSVLDELAKDGLRPAQPVCLTTCPVTKQCSRPRAVAGARGDRPQSCPFAKAVHAKGQVHFAVSARTLRRRCWKTCHASSTLWWPGTRRARHEPAGGAPLPRVVPGLQ
jgi:hypothetical protein